MITYQDFLQVGQDVNHIMAFIHSAIFQHKATNMYKTAVVADEYDKRRNRTIVNYQKLLYTISGKAVPDNFSANYKLCSNFFNRFTVQENQYLLGNGVTWNEESTGEKLGKDFDTRLQELGKYALTHGVAFGFFNLDKVQVFKLTEFVPLLDEEDGAMKAGIRFWQIDDSKPLRATLYELDGYTDFIWNRRDENGKIYYSDPETEYSRIYWLKEEHDLFYKLKEDIGATTGLGYLQYLDPFEAEEKEAEERAHPSPVESSAPEETSIPEPQG